MDYILKIDGLIQKFGKVPGNIQWTTTQRTIAHFRVKGVHTESFNEYLKRSFPCKSVKLVTDGETWTFEASSVSLATLACNWPSKEQLFVTSTLDELPMITDKAQYQLLFDCCSVIVDVVEDCLETCDSLRPEEADFLLTTAA